VRRVLLAIFVVALLQPSPAHAWTQPGQPVRPFQPPEHAYGPGHQGVDFTGDVRAVGGGVVTFAGAVGGTRHVVITHANGWRTSYAYLQTTTVARGQQVAEGDLVGTAGGVGPNHDGTVWHLGLRVGDTYVDPMTLFDGRRRVHLVPVDPLPERRRPVDWPIVCPNC
jgi:murein DD-endopeptidase MepM/ murein hydrolase activator NlpD